MTHPIIHPASGKPIEGIRSDVKKAHDPAEVAAIVQRIDQLALQCFAEFKGEMEADPTAPNAARASWPAAREHHATKFKEVALQVRNGTVPVEINENKVFEMIDEYGKYLAEQLALQMPLRTIKLATQGFSDAGQILHGRLWISNWIALAMDPGGNATIWLRNQEESDEEWYAGWTPRPLRAPWRTAMEYQLQHLKTLLSLGGLGRAIQPTEMQLAEVRTPTKRKRLLGIISMLFVLSIAQVTPCQQFSQSSMMLECTSEKGMITGTTR